MGLPQIMTSTTPEAPAAKAGQGPAKPPRPNTADFDLETLAAAILAREIRPRVGDIRRLAEAVLRQKQKKQAKKAKKARKAGAKGTRKLSKIPAPKAAT